MDRNIVTDGKTIFEVSGGSGLNENRFEFQSIDGSNNDILVVRSSQYETVNEWYHVLFSVDLSDTSKRHLYVNDASDLDQIVTYDTSGTIDFIMDNAVVGATNSGSSAFSGDVADLWIDFGTYIDFSIEANRRKFIDANGDPVYLGASGNLPTGTAPDIFLSGDTATWHTNKGTGGGFTVNGTLANAMDGPDGRALSNGLKVWWKFDETNYGDTVIDSSGNGNDGTMHNGPVQFPSGVFGGAYYLDPLNTYRPYISGTNIFPTGTNPPFTVTMWVKIGNTEGSDDCGAYWANDSYGAQEVYFKQSGASARLEGSGFSNNWKNFYRYPRNQWIMQTETFDGSTVKFYTNDTEFFSNAASGTITGSNFRVGSMNGGSCTVSNLRGAYDDVRVYSRALSPSEITQLYNQGVCANPARLNGSIIYNADSKVLQYCDGLESGNGWQAMGPYPGAGTGGCSNPTRAEGSLIFNKDYQVMQYCDGDNWVSVGKWTPPSGPTGCPSIGDTCSDGTIYAGDSPDGGDPMYTTAADQSSSAYWGTYSYATGATSTVTGKANSAAVYAHVQAGDGSSNPDDGATPNAFVLCEELSTSGHDDWYLPALDELNVLYTNKTAIGGFNISDSYPAGYYWSSSELDDYSPRIQRFSIGTQTNGGKYDVFPVRCVRK